MPVIFFHRIRETTEYTVLTHIGVWVKNQNSDNSLNFFIPDTTVINPCHLIGGTRVTCHNL
jgi:hypothetical protein